MQTGAHDDDLCKSKKHLNNFAWHCIKKDELHVYEKQYKIKRRDNNDIKENVKKRKVVKGKQKTDIIAKDIEHVNSSKSDFSNEINPPSLHVQESKSKSVKNCR